MKRRIPHTVWLAQIFNYSDVSVIGPSSGKNLRLNAKNNLWAFFVSLYLCFALFFPHCLPQKVTGQQQEINNLVQRRTTVGEETALMKKELTALREQLVNKDQELKVSGPNFQWQPGPPSQKVSSLRDTEHDQSAVAIATGAGIILKRRRIGQPSWKHSCLCVFSGFSTSLCLTLSCF